MKSKIILGLFLLIALAMCSSALAASISVPTNPSNMIWIKGVSTTSDNSTKTSFNIQNTGNEPITNLNITLGTLTLTSGSKVIPANSVIAAFNPQINVGGTQTVNVSITSSGASSLSNVAAGTYSGIITITFGNQTKTVPYGIEVKSMLSLARLDVDVDGSSNNRLSDDELIDDEAKPGSELAISVRVENLIDEDEDDSSIEDITVTVTIEEIDDGDDLDDESDEFDLDAEDNGVVDFNFKVPYEVEEGTYRIVVEVEGEREDGQEYSDRITARLKVEKETHELIISRAALSSESVECVRSTDLVVQALNIGKRDEDSSVLEVKSSSLGLDFSNEFELEEGADSDNKQSFNIPIEVPESLKAGTYYIDIKLYYSGDELSDSERLSLVVKDCNLPVDNGDETDDTNSTQDGDTDVVIDYNNQPNDEDNNDVISPVIGEVDTTETSFRDSSKYMYFLLGLNVILIIAIIVILVVLLATRRR